MNVPGDTSTGEWKITLEYLIGDDESCKIIEMIQYL